VSEDNAYYCGDAGVLFDKNKETLIYYPQGKSDDSYIIPDGVTHIKGWAFESCGYLTKLTVPSSVTNIEEYAFIWCDNLTIYGSSGSYAETYAKENEIPFVAGKAPENTPSVSVPAITPKPESGYAVENGVLSGVDEKTSLEALVSNLENGESIVITNADGETITDESTLIGTGYTVSIIDAEGNIIESAAVVVLGDMNGDANANSRDIAALQKHLLGSTVLNGVYFTAGDMNIDAAVNSRDIAALQKKLIG
ncbi:MAG: leucine-rich repeat protein, partial [Clostridia bacterium]|nr:leucine-rich repeat protein [Clostridia bacterium]